MNILIINAFSNTRNGKAKFLSFTNIIKNTFKRISQNSGIENLNYILRTPDNLDEYIFDFIYNTIEGDIKRKNFEKIDIVFIDGTENFLPWKDKGLKLCSFIRLCKLTDKILFASGVGMLSLIYYLATGTHSDYNFINSEGEIEVIEELNKIPASYLKEIKKNDNFLDYVTGDVMQYQNLNKNWISIMNIGLHKVICAEKYYERGKFVLNDNFMGKDYIKNKNSIISNCKELKVQITKHFNSHYLINNIPNEFTVYSTLTWFPHNFNVTYKKFQFKIIGMSFKGPVLIEHENSVGTAFHPSSSYKETIIILQNFIKQKFILIKNKLFKFINEDILINNNEEDITPMFRAYQINDEQNIRKIKEIKDKNGHKIYSNEDMVNLSRAFSRVKKYKNNANHVGFSYNNRDMVFVENNSINQRPVSSVDLFKKNNIFHKKSISEDKFNKENLIKRNENTRISEIFKIEDKKDNNLINNNFNGKEISKKFIENAKKEIEKNEQNTDNYMQFVDKGKMEENQMINYFKKLRKNINEKLEEIKITSEYRKFRYYSKDNEENKNNKKNKDRVIKKLNLNKTNINFFRTKNNNLSKINLKSHTSRNKNNKIKLISIFREQSISNEEKKHYGTYKELSPKLKPETTFPDLTNENNNNKTQKLNKTNSIQKIKNLKSEYRYLTLEEYQRKEFLESKKKWVSKEDFHRFFGLHTTSLKPIPNAMESGQPISNYKYREIYPEKWLTSNGFVV